MPGIAAVDRRAVYQALRWGSYRNRDVTAHQRGMMKSVVTGSPVFQKHFFAAGLAESATCGMCTGEDEHEVPAYWRCPAWAHIRRRFFQQPSVTVDHLPAITQHCGLLTTSSSDAGDFYGQGTWEPNWPSTWAGPSRGVRRKGPTNVDPGGIAMDPIPPFRWNEWCDDARD